jgi:hypothetical protein
VDAFVPNEVTIYPLADLLPGVPTSGSTANLQTIHEEQVLIFNWDAINGDPEFGSHSAMHWIQHHRPEILLWISDGHVLIIEGQATLGVPCQQAYDATVGPGELLTSVLDEPHKPLEFKTRIGAECLKTRHFPEERGFANLASPILKGDYLGREN